MAQKKLPKKITRTISEYVSALRNDKLPISRVILFGSWAKGTQHKWSDIDLCVISPKFRNAWDAMQYLWSKRVSDIGHTIEPIGFHPRDFQDDTSLTLEIKKHGIEMKV